jgi:acetyltransferase
LLSGRQLQPGELERWTDIDPTREIALIAVVAEGDGEQEIAVARCVFDDRDPLRWDFAIVIGDAWQGRGLGEALLQRLIDCAGEAGVGILSGITLSDNYRMLALGRKLGFSTRREAGDSTLTRIEKQI